MKSISSEAEFFTIFQIVEIFEKWPLDKFVVSVLIIKWRRDWKQMEEPITSHDGRSYAPETT